MSMKKFRFFVPLLILMLILCGCSTETTVDEDDIVILEPGNPEDAQDNEQGSESEIKFIDKGEFTTIEDLTAAQAKISSYYYEQRIPYTDASVFIRVWYADNSMKVISSVDGYVLTEFYYDFDEMTMISYSPADSDTGIKVGFSLDSEEAPDNPLALDYPTLNHTGTEDVNRQLCYIFENTNGEKYWISTEYGFPLQKEFSDHLGERYTISYKNIKINTVSADQVAVPEEMQIYDLETI